MKLRRHSTVLGLELPVLEAIAAATPAPMAAVPVASTKKAATVPVVVVSLKTTAATRMMRTSSIDN